MITLRLACETHYQPWGRTMRLYLIATQIVFYVAIIPWVFLWLMAFVLIMHSASTQNIVIFSLTSIYPVVLIVCTIFAWYFHMNKKSVSIAINLIPAIWWIIIYVY